MVRVVVVDDSVFMREVLKDIIRSIGWEIVGEAADGEEAIRICRELGPDLVTMDIIMPGIGGEEATRGIKADNPAIKVIMVTAVGGQEEIMRGALAAGAESDHITKPFKKDLVRTALEKVYGK